MLILSHLLKSQETVETHKAKELAASLSGKSSLGHKDPKGRLPARPLPVLHPGASTFLGLSLQQALLFTAGLADSFQTKIIHV